MTDVVMPELGGPELPELPQQRPGLKVLFVSGHTESDRDRRCAERTPPPFLQKPFSANALKRRVREVLDGD